MFWKNGLLPSLLQNNAPPGILWKRLLKYRDNILIFHAGRCLEDNPGQDRMGFLKLHLQQIVLPEKHEDEINQHHAYGQQKEQNYGQPDFHNNKPCQLLHKLYQSMSRPLAGAKRARQDRGPGYYAACLQIYHDLLNNEQQRITNPLFGRVKISRELECELT